MKLKIRIMEIENDTVAKKDYLDLLDISAEVGEEEDDQLFQWVKSLYLVDEDGNTYPRIAAHVREIGVDVERVLSEEVHTDINSLPLSFTHTLLPLSFLFTLYPFFSHLPSPHY
ncbi:hypothetical protein AAG906_032230 [Vitis piasezkii]